MDNEIDRLVDLMKHEEGVFNNRAGIFLTVHGLLLTASGFFQKGGPAPRVMLVAIGVVGMLLGLVWLYVQARQRYIIDFLDKELSSKDPNFYVRLRQHVTQSVFGFVSSSTVLAVYMPVGATLAWAGFILLHLFA
jgi:hypothetical protein